ncbi:MAG: host attachment protein [Allorhizobium sp.]
MNRIKVPAKSWIVVCDGAKALILQNDGDALQLNLRVAEVLSQPDERDRDLGSERPGRVHESQGTRRSAVEQTNFHEVAEAEFLKGLAEKLSEMVYNKTMQKFILIAAPKALGALRPHFNSAVEAAITLEVAKDLVKMPIGDIERHITGMMEAR